MSFSLSEFTSFSITVPATDTCKTVTIHGVKSSPSSSSPFRPPLLCLHGFPQTHHMWFKVAPFLAERFTVVATDLRGYGESSKPEDDGTHELYSKRCMANDQVEVMCGLRSDYGSLIPKLKIILGNSWDTINSIFLVMTAVQFVHLLNSFIFELTSVHGIACCDSSRAGPS